ncbi:hypothetical protein K466DRAFT_221590 [Polyporus arcularius HHB13444]|uniref:Uncharacterized protein n=1 Tax=Polyporus arcularius HHB13444 TaxID=1314778 RepID=A0A5C3P4E9_9APHY|nr:hypothetical protein K466DRAFT_221590 [Polyporus arcularius HHB13444]
MDDLAEARRLPGPSVVEIFLIYLHRRVAGHDAAAGVPMYRYVGIIAHDQRHGLTSYLCGRFATDLFISSGTHSLVEYVHGLHSIRLHTHPPHFLLALLCLLFIWLSSRRSHSLLRTFSLLLSFVRLRLRLFNASIMFTWRPGMHSITTNGKILGSFE